MRKFSLGVLLDSFQTDLLTAMKQAANLGLDGFQIYTVSGEMAPENLTDKARREFRALAAGHGLEICALCGDLSAGFTDSAKNPVNIERTKRIFDLALELGTNIVTSHIGIVPDDSRHPRFRILQDACGQIAEYAASLQAYFAIETGPEEAVVLRRFLDELANPGLAVNLDPANLVMTFGTSAVEAVYELKDYLVHTHAKDGIFHQRCDVEVLYGAKPPPGPFNELDYCEEVPLGEGQVEWEEYLAALASVGYRGYLTIERETGENPLVDIRLAVEFLQKLLGKE